MGRGGGRPGEEKRQRGKGREEKGESDQGSEVREGGDREEVKTSQRPRTGRERGKWLKQRHREAEERETGCRGEDAERVDGGRGGNREYEGSIPTSLGLQEMETKKAKRGNNIGPRTSEKQTKKSVELIKCHE